jgi:hypothetical protein
MQTYGFSGIAMAQTGVLLAIVPAFYITRWAAMFGGCRWRIEPARGDSATVALSAARLSVLFVAAMATVAAQAPPFHKTRITFKSGDLTLVGYTFHPDGAGRFPTVIWNHGSEKDPGGGRQFDAVAGVFVPHGYAVVAPVRRGHTGSEGTYIADATEALRKTGDASWKAGVVRRSRPSSSTINWPVSRTKTLPFVDATRLVVAGCSRRHSVDPGRRARRRSAGGAADFARGAELERQMRRCRSA